MSGSIIVISGPSAVGKSRVVKEVLQCGENIKFITSYTTRPPREKEENGKDYHFVSEEKFLHLVKTGEMLEWKKNDLYYYGTPKFSVEDNLEKGVTLLLDIDPSGFNEIKKMNFPSVNGIYLLPESLIVLYDQILARGANRGIKNAEDADLRFQNSINSIRKSDIYDLVMINKKVSETAKLIINWINIINLYLGRKDLLTNWYKENGLLL